MADPVASRRHTHRGPRSSRPARTIAWGLGVALIASAACTRGPADPAQELLRELEAAAEARDADRFSERLSAEFHGSGAGAVTKADAVATVRRYFAAYDSVGIDVSGVEAQRDGARADVRCVVEFSGKARPLLGLQGLLPPSAAYRFELDVRDEGAAWRVRGASWEVVAPADR